MFTLLSVRTDPPMLGLVPSLLHMRSDKRIETEPLNRKAVIYRRLLYTYECMSV